MQKIGFRWQDMQILHLDVAHFHWTNSINLSPSWKATRRSGNQEFSITLWNPKFLHCVRKNPLLVHILSQLNPFHTTSFYFFNNNFNNILPPTFIFLLFSFLLAFPTKSYMHSSFPHSCYMLLPYHPSSLYHSDYIWRRVQVIKPEDVWTYS
jgi:hypothetical protein